MTPKPESHIAVSDESLDTLAERIEGLRRAVVRRTIGFGIVMLLLVLACSVAGLSLWRAHVQREEFIAKHDHFVVDVIDTFDTIITSADSSPAAKDYAATQVAKFRTDLIDENDCPATVCSTR